MIKKLTKLLLITNAIYTTGAPCNQKKTSTCTKKNHGKCKKSSLLEKLPIYHHHSSITDLYSTIDELMESFFVPADIEELNKLLHLLNKQLFSYRWKDEYTVAKYELLLKKHKEKDYLSHTHHILERLNEVVFQSTAYIKENPNFNGPNFNIFIHNIKHIIKNSNLLMMDYMVLSHGELSMKDIYHIISEEKHHKHNTILEHIKKVKPKKYVMKIIALISKNNFLFNEALLSKLEDGKNLTEENIKYIAKQVLVFDKSFKIPLRILRTLFDMNNSVEFKELEEMYRQFDTKWHKILQKNNILNEIIEALEQENTVYSDFEEN